MSGGGSDIEVLGIGEMGIWDQVLDASWYLPTEKRNPGAEYQVQ